MVLIQVRESESHAPVAMALIEAGQGIVATTDSSGNAWVTALDQPVPVRIVRTGYSAVDTILAASDTISVLLTRAPFPLPAVQIVESREVSGVWCHAAVVCSTSADDESMASSLGRIAGVEVDKVGGGVFVGLRGSGSAGTEAWLDGIPLSDARLGGADMSGILPGVLEQLIVYQGWAPLSLGGGALGGALALETISPRPQERLRARLGVGSLGRRDAGFGVTVPWPDGWIWTGLEALVQDNDFGYMDDNATPLNHSDDTLRVRANSRVETLNLLVKSAIGLEDGPRWVLTSLASDRREGVPGTGADPVRYARHTSQALRLALRHVRPVARGWKGSLLGFAQWTCSEVDDPEAELSHMAGSVINRSRGGGVSLYGAREEGAIRPDARVEMRVEGIVAETPGLHRQSQGRVTLSEGLGLTWCPGLPVRWRAEGSVLGFRNWGEDQSVLHELKTGRAACELELTGYGSLLVSASAQGRPPALIELLGNAGSIRGNPGLTPERSLQFEAVLASSGETLRLALYHKTVTDLIQFWLRSPKVVMPENIGEARMRGLELAATLRGHGALIAHFAGAVQRTEDRSQAPYYRGNRLPGWPVWTMSATAVSHIRNGWSMSMEARARGEVFVDRANRRSSNAAFQVGAGAQVHLLRTLLFGVAGENLFDQKGFDRWGYPEPGRRWRTRVFYQF
ncbi:TonB-dependent receptor [Candidatus Fermentibacteria bacterium]|nr:TonB-dependent receptor [Candidatus Fermentibacteria bacterium]